LINPAGEYNEMSTETSALRTRLRDDLRSAMKDRDTLTTKTLRSMLEAMDNASAILMTAEHVPVYGRSGDVPRRIVTEDDYRRIVRNEAAARQAAAIEYERLGRIEAAAHVRAELEVVMRYIDS
jgi:uncharacterized protein YqeY